MADIHVAGPTGHTATFPLPRDRGAYAVVCRRADLDAAIVDRARAAGATVVEGVEVTGARDAGDRVELDLADGGSTLSALYVVAADGMYTSLRKHLGTAEPGYLGEWHAFRQYFRNTGLGRSGPVGVVRGRPAARVRLELPPRRARQRRLRHPAGRQGSPPSR
ncbi:MAG: FAD-dependent monooxygenase [Acidimicrobiales bacterium]